MKRTGQSSNHGQSDHQGSEGILDGTLADNKRCEFRDVDGFYGNGTCYVVDADSVHKFRDCNFNLERLDLYSEGPDYWIVDEVVVAFGYGVTAKQGIRALQRLIRTIRKNANRKSSKSIASG